MSLQALAGSPMVQRLGWTLLHSLWQALAVAIGLALVLPLVRKRGANASYVAGCGALLVAGLAPILTFSLLPHAPPAAVANRHVAAPIDSIAMSRSPTFQNIPAFESRRLEPNESRLDERVAPLPDRAPAFVAPPRGTVSLSDQIARLRRELPVKASAWLPWIVLVWSLGVLALSLWNIGAWLAVQRMKARATEPVAVAIQSAADRLARRLSLPRTVRLLQSKIVDSPLVIGVIKPVILFPASLVTELPVDQLESLLAHELAHVLRQDYLVNLLQSAIETLLFYHPAVWWISSQVRCEREHCCDDIAVHLVQDRTIYVRALAAVAGARAPALTPAATGGLLLPRLRRVLGIATPQATHPARWLTGAALLLLCVGATTFVAIDSRSAKAQTGAPKSTKSESTTKTLAPKAPEVTKEPEATTKGSMQVAVVDTAGQPLADARIHASVWTEEKGFKANRDYTSDAHGIATIELPKTLTILRLWASKGGYSALFLNLDANRQALDGPLVPDTITFRLPRGTVMGGTVKNEDGKGIEGVRIQTSYESGGDRIDGAFNHSLNDKVVTDADGRWRLDTVPPGEKVQIRLELEHPDYISHRPWREIQRAQKVTSESLRSQTAAIVMERGIAVRGTVTSRGEPVENAVVIQGDRPYWEQGPQEVRTDKEGVYRFPPLPPGPMRVTVVAEGWSPDSRKIEIAPKLPPVDFDLKTGKKLRIRFVDQAGAPVPDVYVSIENWRGAESLYNHKHPNVIDVRIPRKADKDGLFEWSWAPEDAVTYNFGKSGYAVTMASITPGETEHIQTINPILRIAGSVRDAVTGKPIDEFLAVPVLYFRPDFPMLDRDHALREKAGRLNLELDRTDIEHGVQIEVPGYALYRSPGRYQVGEAIPELDVRLKPIAKFTGRIRDGQGRAVEGASVYVATPFQHLQLSAMKDEDFTSNYSVRSDANGDFAIIPPLEPNTLVVVANEGYAEVRRDVGEPPGEIRIQPWANVSGKLVQSGNPVPNHTVFLEPIRNAGVGQPYISCDFQGQTGEDGSFNFARVPPIPCRVRGFVHFSRETPLRSGHSIPLQLSPGEDAWVELGTKGIDVTGKLVINDAPADFDYHFSISHLVARKPGIEPPAHLDLRSFDWRKGWNDAWMGTQEGQAYLNTLQHWFVKPRPDGQFSISGVEPGEYDFAVRLYGSTDGCLVHPVATRVIGVTVQPGQKALDLGRLEIPSLKLPKVGDVASDFEFTGLDGKPTSLAAFRGRYVLLDFWATWCSPCVAKLEEVEGLRKEFAPDNGLVVIGVNLDTDTERAKQFLKKRSLPWQHALLGEWSNTDVPQRFAVSNVPTYILVGPDGRIVAHEFSLEALAAKLKAAKGTSP